MGIPAAPSSWTQEGNFPRLEAYKHWYPWIMPTNSRETRMTRPPSRNGFFLSVALAFLLAMGPRPLQGQSNPPPISRIQFGLGYVGNAPDAILGGAGYLILPELGPISGGIGLYVDAKFDLDDPTDERGFNPDVTVEELLNDPTREITDFLRSETTWWSVNLALIRPLNPFLMAYAGGGIAFADRYALFNVPQNDPVGVGGVVWAEDPSREETRMNLMAGILMRLTASVSTHFGVETQPRGLTVGISLRLPKW